MGQEACKRPGDGTEPSAGCVAAKRLQEAGGCVSVCKAVCSKTVCISRWGIDGKHRRCGELAGVGKTTVSHALSGKRHVAPATRERILTAVSQLGYHPNAAARSLASRRTMTVGLIVPLDLDVLSDNRSTDFIVGAADQLASHGYQLLCLVERNPDVSGVQKLIRSGQVDGTLLFRYARMTPGSKRCGPKTGPS